MNPEERTIQHIKIVLGLVLGFGLALGMAAILDKLTTIITLLQK